MHKNAHKCNPTYVAFIRTHDVVAFGTGILGPGPAHHLHTNGEYIGKLGARKIILPT